MEYFFSLEKLSNINDKKLWKQKVVFHFGQQQNSAKTQTNLFNRALTAKLIHFLKIIQVLKRIKAKIVVYTKSLAWSKIKVAHY